MLNSKIVLLPHSLQPKTKFEHMKLKAMNNTHFSSSVFRPVDNNSPCSKYQHLVSFADIKTMFTFVLLGASLVILLPGTRQFYFDL